MRLNPMIKLSLGLAALGLPQHPFLREQTPTLKHSDIPGSETSRLSADDIRKLDAAKEKRRRKAQRKANP